MKAKINYLYQGLWLGMLFFMLNQTVSNASDCFEYMFDLKCLGVSVSMPSETFTQNASAISDMTIIFQPLSSQNNTDDLFSIRSISCESEMDMGIPNIIKKYQAEKTLKLSNPLVDVLTEYTQKIVLNSKCSERTRILSFNVKDKSKPLDLFMVVLYRLQNPLPQKLLSLSGCFAPSEFLGHDIFLRTEYIVLKRAFIIQVPPSMDYMSLILKCANPSIAAPFDLDVVLHL